MITITCLRAVATGGTELLHQLGYKLRLFGFDACICYFGENNGKEETHPYFKKYGIPVCETIKDSPDNIIVHPEMMASHMRNIMERFPHSRHVFWWLSVDNANMTPELEKEFSEDKKLIHLVQSYYAMDYVRDTLRVPEERLFYLSDYINSNFLNIDNCQKRDNTVLFNPRKGFERTAKLIQSSDLLRIKWRELAGIAPEKIPGVLQSAKVYIDFGNHPGKDRFPREAVACGCRLITGKRGSAGNDRDIPIPVKYKISDDTDDTVILERIYSLIDSYEETEGDFTGYKKMIDEEFHSFEADTLIVFSKITGGKLKGCELDEEGLKRLITDAVTGEDYSKALYFMTIYRISGYTVDDTVLLLEGYTRLAIAEDQVVIYLMNDLLGRCESNYEAYLLKARAMLALGHPGADEALDLAIRYSRGTDDEEYVSDAVGTLRS